MTSLTKTVCSPDAMPRKTCLSMPSERDTSPGGSPFRVTRTSTPAKTRSSAVTVESSAVMRWTSHSRIGGGVGEDVGVGVDALVGVGVGVPIGVGVSVLVGVAVGVLLGFGVGVGVSVGTGTGVRARVSLGVGVAVGAGV